MARISEDELAMIGVAEAAMPREVEVAPARRESAVHLGEVKVT